MTPTSTLFPHPGGEQSLEEPVIAKKSQPPEPF
jgi:hypothetical protein